jgi:superfamily II DNA or RNA helicase
VSLVDKAASNLEIPQPTDSLEEEEPPALPSLPTRDITRPYQSAALHALTKALAQHTDVLLALPTGSGKTFVAVKWLSDNVIRHGGRVVWVAHRHELLEQTYLTFVRILPAHEFNSITWWTGSKPKNPNGKVLLVSVAATQSFPMMDADVLVIDEAHHEPAATYQRLRERIRYKKQIGLTATPERLDAKALGYECIAYQCTFFSLVEEGWLAKPMPVLPKTGLAFELEERMEDFTEESLAQLDNEQRNRFIVEHWQQNRLHYSKTLVFSVNQRHARRLVQLFEAICPDVCVDYIVSGESSPAERERKVQDFREGHIQILVNCRIFTEGFDVPDVKTIFLTRPTLSATLYLQMVGRGTRVTPTKSDFYLVDFQDNLGRFQVKLITPWILGDNRAEISAAIEEARNVAIDKVLDNPPQWLKDELALAPVELNDIAGYVEYEHGSGRKTGFIVHLADEVTFTELWQQIDEFTPEASGFSAAHAQFVIKRYEAAPFKRIALEDLIAACIARTYRRARYIKLLRNVLPAPVEEFLGDVELSPEERGNLTNSFATLTAIMKYRVDEIDPRLESRPVYRIYTVRMYRGLGLRQALEQIYLSSLTDTNITAFEWERFAIYWIMHPANALLYISEHGHSEHGHKGSLP